MADEYYDERVCRGNSGQTIFNRTHSDMDDTSVNVSVESGSIEIYLEERVWWTWSTSGYYGFSFDPQSVIFYYDNDEPPDPAGLVRTPWRISSGNSLYVYTNHTSPFDRDYRLRIIAKDNGTTVHVIFASQDY